MRTTYHIPDCIVIIYSLIKNISILNTVELPQDGDIAWEGNMRHFFLFAFLAACDQRPLGPVQASTGPLCLFDAPKDRRAVLASAAANRLELIHADGSRTTAYTFGPA